MLWKSRHVVPSPQDQIGRWFQAHCRYQSYQYGQPSTQNGPEMMMQIALHKPGVERQNKPSRWMPSGPIE